MIDTPRLSGRISLPRASVGAAASNRTITGARMHLDAAPARALDGHMGLRGLSYRSRLTPYAAGGTNVGWFAVLAIVVAVIVAAQS
jgi:hypothetical protein